jgi:crotonobetainyl-CoA:carnitine CoA-transferase CaiB-like acyl-CoA transferase
MGLGELARDARFATFADRLAHREALLAVLRQAFSRRTTAAWLACLRGHVPIAPVYSVEEALEDEQVLAREMVVEVGHPVLGTLREVGCPIKFGGVAPVYRAAAPLGADTASLLAEVGVDAAEVADLRSRGIV